jgi:hypothetical protein
MRSSLRERKPDLFDTPTFPVDSALEGVWSKNSTDAQSVVILLPA